MWTRSRWRNALILPPSSLSSGPGRTRCLVPDFDGAGRLVALGLGQGDAMTLEAAMESRARHLIAYLSFYVIALSFDAC